MKDALDTSYEVTKLIKYSQRRKKFFNLWGKIYQPVLLQESEFHVQPGGLYRLILFLALPEITIPRGKKRLQC